MAVLRPLKLRCVRRFIGDAGLLSWVNVQLEEELTSMSELADGIVFCRLLDRLFHASFPLRKVLPSAGSLSTVKSSLRIGVLTFVLRCTAAAWRLPNTTAAQLQNTAWLSGVAEDPVPA